MKLVYPTLILFLFLVACDKEEETPPPPELSVVALVGSTQQNISEMQEIAPGDSIQLYINAKFRGGLQFLNIFDGISRVNTELDESSLMTMGTDTLVNFKYTIQTTEFDANSFIDYVVSITDNFNQSDTVRGEFLVGASRRNADLFSFFEIQAPQPDRQSRSFFSTFLRETYSWNDVINDQSKSESNQTFISQHIDFGMYGDSEDGIVLSSPYAFRESAYDHHIEGWDSLRQTRFYALDIDQNEFSSITTYEQIDQVMSDAVLLEGGKVSSINEDQFFGFSIGEDNRGIIRIREVVDGNSDGLFDNILDKVIIDLTVQQDPFDDSIE